MKRDLTEALLADLEQIEDNARLFIDGRNSAYQGVAIQLRNLLLNGRQGLLARVIDRPTLHPLKAHEVPAPSSPKSQVAIIFGNLDLSPFGRTRARAALPVDLTATPISVGKWCQQWVIMPDIKIEDLIREATNDEVAHTNQERASTLAKAGHTLQWGSGEDILAGRADSLPVDRYIYQMAIVAIGEYVAARARELLAERGARSP